MSSRIIVTRRAFAVVLRHLRWFLPDAHGCAAQNYWGYFDKAQVAPETSSTRTLASADSKDMVPLPPGQMDETMVLQLMNTKTGVNDPSKYSEEELAEHVAYLMKAMRPVNRATYRNEGMSFLTGKRPRPRIGDLPPGLVAEANAEARGDAGNKDTGPQVAEVASSLIPGPCELGFDEQAIEVLENCGVVTLTIRRSGGTSGQCSCEYASADISATQGKDYVAAKGTLTFESGVTSMTIQIKIIDDDQAEGKEKFRVQLSSPSGCTIRDREDLAVVTIASDEVLKSKFGNVLARQALAARALATRLPPWQGCCVRRAPRYAQPCGIWSAATGT